MGVITFDKLAYVEALKNAGIPDVHARAHAMALDDALRDGVATKADLEHEGDTIRSDIAAARGELKSEISETRAELKVENGETRVELKVEIAKANAELKADIARVEAKITTVAAETKTDILRWVFAALAMQTALLFGLVKMFGHG